MTAHKALLPALIACAALLGACHRASDSPRDAAPAAGAEASEHAERAAAEAASAARAGAAAVGSAARQAASDAAAKIDDAPRR